MDENRDDLFETENSVFSGESLKEIELANEQVPEDLFKEENSASVFSGESLKEIEFADEKVPEVLFKEDNSASVFSGESLKEIEFADEQVPEDWFKGTAYEEQEHEESQTNDYTSRDSSTGASYYSGGYSSNQYAGYNSQTGYTNPYQQATEQASYTEQANPYSAVDSDIQEKLRQREEKLIAQAKKKADRKAKKANKKAAKASGSKGAKSKGKKIGSLIAAAVVFGLVAGAVFQGVRYGSDKLLGNNDDTTTVTESAVTNEKTTEVSSTEASTEASSSLNISSGDTVTTTYDVATVAENVLPSIVSITGTYVTTETYFFNTYEYESEGAGSGIIISMDDDYVYILTNYHVVEDSKILYAGFVDDESAEATIKGYDSSNDVAVVTVNISDLSEDTLSQIEVITVGSSDSLRVGDPCVAIGNALGYGQSVTVGYVSALNREIEVDDGGTITVLQTDAAINPGNSGGALVNMAGELIGVNTAKYVDSTVEGMGYAIPISNITDLIEDLIAGNTTSSTTTGSGNGYLGVAIADITSEYAAALNMPEGVYINSVTEGSPAETAGLQSGDIIVAVDGTEITSSTELQAAISSHNAGDEVEITFYRNQNGQYVSGTVKATLAAKSS